MVESQIESHDGIQSAGSKIREFYVLGYGDGGGTQMRGSGVRLSGKRYPACGWRIGAVVFVTDQTKTEGLNAHSSSFNT
jgi:hypothetical protein